MIKHKEHKILPFSQEQLYILVADVERYPEFLPWCKQLIIREKQENKLRAELTLGYKFFQESYMSEVTLNPFTEINVQYANKGPLKYLKNQWNFKALTQKTCEVNFDLEFELKSFFLQKTVESVFTVIVDQMLGAFEARAKQLYT